MPACFMTGMQRIPNKDLNYLTEETKKVAGLLGKQCPGNVCIAVLATCWWWRQGHVWPQVVEVLTRDAEVFAAYLSTRLAGA